MVKTIQAREISLYELEEKFGLQVIKNTEFLTEWTENLPTLTDGEKQAIARVQSNYFNLNKRRPMSEEAVKMVVLSPLLDLAGFYQPPFEIETETSIEISAEDEGFVVKLIQQEQPKYARSYALSIERHSELYQVLSILKRIGELTLNYD
ncbi:MAG: type I restriction endonuclease subunit R [Hassallia sp. WJT32-NPBG1]|jgi:hypothetical protein|nr:type I restriction endonuclease subunit R [Hassallia sp. WJT32-NPBG1]